MGWNRNGDYRYYWSRKISTASIICSQLSSWNRWFSRTLLTQITGEVTSGIISSNYATQFHPEKSQSKGIHWNFLENTIEVAQHYFTPNYYLLIMSDKATPTFGDSIIRYRHYRYRKWKLDVATFKERINHLWWWWKHRFLWKLCHLHWRR